MTRGRRDAHPKYGWWPSPHEPLVVPSPGASKSTVSLPVEVSRCGGVDDGVSINMPEGPFVISFKSLERWYLANKKLRAEALAYKRRNLRRTNAGQ